MTQPSAAALEAAKAALPAHPQLHYAIAGALDWFAAQRERAVRNECLAIVASAYSGTEEALSAIDAIEHRIRALAQPSGGEKP